MSRSSAERGGAGLTTLLGSMLLAVVALVAVVAASDLTVTTARASSAADAAALAAAGASPLAGGDADPQAAARRLARANGARVADLDDSRWPRRVTVAVAVSTRTSLVRAVLPAVRVEAAAMVVPVGR